MSNSTDCQKEDREMTGICCPEALLGNLNNSSFQDMVRQIPERSKLKRDGEEELRQGPRVPPRSFQVKERLPVPGQRLGSLGSPHARHQAA